MSSVAGSIPFSFFFNDTATTEIYTLSLHDALPIYHEYPFLYQRQTCHQVQPNQATNQKRRSEERFSRNAETDLVCRLLLEKKKEDDLQIGAWNQTDHDDNLMKYAAYVPHETLCCRH